MHYKRRRRSSYCTQLPLFMQKKAQVLSIPNKQLELNGCHHSFKHFFGFKTYCSLVLLLYLDYPIQILGQSKYWYQFLGLIYLLQWSHVWTEQRKYKIHCLLEISGKMSSDMCQKPGQQNNKGLWWYAHEWSYSCPRVYYHIIFPQETC